MKKIITTATSLLLLIATSIKAQQIIYVKANAQGASTGMNWENAMPDLQTALNQATYGTEIRIAAGVYRPTNGVNRDSTFYLKNGFRLRGGFAGEGPDADNQAPSIYQTILSGDIGVPNNQNDNSYSVVTSSGDLDETTLLEGLIIECGEATSNNPNDQPISHRKSGGGLYIKTGVTNNLQIIRCLFRNNRAVSNGAHIMVWQPNGQSNLRVQNCQFIDGAGGSAFQFYGNSPDSIFISHCSFFRHHSFPGLSGIVIGIYPNANYKINKVLVESCLFQENQIGDSTALNGNILGIGGDTAIMRNCRFIENLHSNGSLATITGHKFSLIYQDTFKSNKSNYNGGQLLQLSNWPTNPIQVVADCIFDKNEETILVYTWYSAIISKCKFLYNVLERTIFEDQNTTGYNKLITVNSCTFKYNKYKSLVDFVTIAGGNYPVDNKSWVFNQNLFSENTGLLFDARNHHIFDHLSIVNWNYCTFSDNHFPNGHTGDTLPYLFDLRNIDLATFNSCIFDQPLQDSLKLFYDSLVIVQLKNNVFLADSCSQTYQFGNTLFCDTSNFWGVSPIFEDKADENFRISGCSPGINKGDVQLTTQLGLSTDLNNSNRIENGLPDIGAFENKLFLQGSVAQYSCIKPASGTLLFTGNTCGPYTYEWWNGFESGTSNIGLPSSKYEISVTDYHGIVYYDTLFIPEFESMAIDTILQNPSSITAQDGSITVPNVFNGLPPYHFSWSTGDSTSTIEGLAVGPYILTITDQLGCQIIFLFQLTSSTIGTQNISEEKPLIYLIPNLSSKSSSSRLFCPEGVSEIMIVDAFGRVVLSEQADGTEFLLPSMGYEGVFWIFGKDSKSGNWIKPLRFVAY